jgi:hypothetical protein
MVYYFLISMEVRMNSEEPRFVEWTFDSLPKDQAATLSVVWILIYGELCITEPGQFKVEIVESGRKVQIHHPSAELLVRLTEAFYERRWEKWNPARLQLAYISFVANSFSVKLEV